MATITGPRIVVIKKDGVSAGAAFPVPDSLQQISFGKSLEECDIRIQKVGVSNVHLILKIAANGQLTAGQMSEVNPTLLNEKPMRLGDAICHNDVFNICGRKFRFENPTKPKSAASPKRRLATPLRNAIHSRNVAPSTAPEGRTPSARKSTRRSVAFAAELSPEVFDKDMPPATPVRRGRQPAAATKPQADLISFESPVASTTPASTGKKTRKLQTPLRNAISAGVSLRNVKENVTPTPVSRGKTAVPTPAREAIKAGVALKATKKKIQTPLRNDIKRGVKLQQVTKKGAVPTPAREAIRAGVTLRATKKKMEDDLQAAIKGGVDLRKIIKKSSVSTPAREAIKSGVQLRATKKKLQTPLRNQITEGVKLAAVMKKSAVSTPVRAAIKEGVSLRPTMKKPLATPVRAAIKAGVTLRRTKNKLQTPLRMEIHRGSTLNRVIKRSAVATPAREAIKAGVQLRQTKKRLQTPLRKQIASGAALKPVMKKAAIGTPVRNAIKSGVALRPIIKKSALSTPVKNDICQGVELRKVMRKALNTPLRQSIKSKPLLKKMKSSFESMAAEDKIKVATAAAMTQLKETDTPVTDVHQYVREEDEETLFDIFGAAVFANAEDLDETIQDIFDLSESGLCDPEDEEVDDHEDTIPNIFEVVGPDFVAHKDGDTVGNVFEFVNKEDDEEATIGDVFAFVDNENAEEDEEVTVGDIFALAASDDEDEDANENNEDSEAEGSEAEETCNFGEENELTVRDIFHFSRFAMALEDHESDDTDDESEEELEEDMIEDEVTLRDVCSMEFEGDSAETHGDVDEEEEETVADVFAFVDETEQSTQVTTRKSLKTPVREAIKAGTTLRQTKKKMQTPLRQSIQQGAKLKKVLKKGAVSTPAREAIKAGVKLRATKKKMATPLRKQILEGKKLATVMKKSAVGTPTRKAIKAGVQLKETKKKLQTPLRKAIKEGTSLRKVPTEADMAPLPKQTPKLTIPKLDVMALLVRELRAELEQRGLSTAGKKADLQKRLKAALATPPPELPAKELVDELVVDKRKLSIISEDGQSEPDENDCTVPDSEPLPDFTAMKVAELKAELSSRGLDTKGLKKVLLARLIEATSCAEAPAEVEEAQLTDANVSDAAVSMTQSTVAEEEVPLPDFTSMKVVELKAELSARGLDTTGLKKVLLARLIAATSPSIDAVVDEAPKMAAVKQSKPQRRSSKRAAENQDPDADVPKPRATRGKKAKAAPEEVPQETARRTRRSTRGSRA